MISQTWVQALLNIFSNGNLSSDINSFVNLDIKYPLWEGGNK